MGPAKSARASLTPPPSRAGMVLVNRLPGASTSMSAASIDSMTPGGAGIPAGSTETSETCFPTSWTTDSPRVTVPSAKRTTSVRLSVAAGRTRPLILKNRAACSTPSQNPPAMSASAAIIMLPTLWSFRSPGASKRYSKTSASLRRPASATRQFLTSPGGATPSSWRRRPLEPPSSATVTTAARSPTLSLKPLSNTGKPVPPPNATIFKFSTLRMGPKYTAHRNRLGEDSCPFVRPGEIEDRTLRHDAGRVDALVAPIVMLLYVVHVHRLRHTRLLIEISQISPQVRIVHDAPQVALEVSMVNGVEAHQGGKQAPVGLRHAVAAQVAPPSENILPIIQRIEDVGYGIVVHLLLGGEAGAIDAVVDGLVDSVNGLVDLVTQVFGEESGISGGKLFELRVEHAHDLARLIVDDRTGLPVPQHGGGNAPRVARVGLRVDLPQKLSTVYVVGYNAGLITKCPTVLAHKRPDGREPNNLLQPLQSAHDRRPVCPRACPRDVQMIPARLRRKLTAPVGRDPIPKTRSLAHEPPVRVLPLPLGLPLALYESSRHLPPFGRRLIAPSFQPSASVADGVP